MKFQVKVGEKCPTLEDVTGQLETVSLRISQIRDFINILEDVIDSDLQQGDGTDLSYIKISDNLYGLTAMVKLALDKTRDDANDIISKCMVLDVSSTKGKT